MDKMKAARLHKIGEELRIDLVEVPKTGAEDVLINIKASGICHSDLNYRDGVGKVGKLPITLGHEIAGTIEEVGDRVEGIMEGDRVCVHYVISCGNCYFCRTNRENFCEKYQMIGRDVDGGFAEYAKVPARNVLNLPKNIPFEQGAIMGCAVSTAFHALRRGRAASGNTVVIYGVGGLGVHAVQLAKKIFEADIVIAVDISNEKLKIARQNGADYVIDASVEDPAQRISGLTNGKLADVVLDFVGLKKTIEKAIDCVGNSGKMVLVGIGSEDIKISPYKTIIGREMELIGVNDHLKSELAELIKLAASGKIGLSASITQRMGLDEVNYGMEILDKKIENPIRVVVVQ
jgi:2-desacetyl-2-hydroxyethyl bacteriochlorophyllide A dehydrogenase